MDLNILLETLTRCCQSIHLYGRTSTYNSIQRIWGIAVARPTIDRIAVSDDTWAIFLANLPDHLETDLILLYGRIMSTVEYSKFTADFLAKAVTRSAHLYYGAEGENSKEVQTLITRYKENPHIMILKLMELLSVDQLRTIGLIPTKDE